MMTSAIVILNWNGRDFLRKYLPPLLSSIEGIEGTSVVVADNASDDGSVQMLQQEFPSVRTIVLDRNYGFAGGYNRALKKLDEDLFLLLNSDVEVHPDWYPQLLQWMELHPDCGICGPMLHQTENRDNFEYAGAAGGFIDRYGYPFCRGRVMDLVEQDSGQYDIPADVLWVSGAALMIRSSLFKSLGGFRAEFFAHMEEIDLCWRARLEGWKVSVVPRSIVYHVGGGTLNAGSPQKLFLNYRNNLLMLQRCMPKTLAVSHAYNLMARYTFPEEGPDLFHNCESLFNGPEFDNETRGAILDTSVDLAVMHTKALLFWRRCLDGLSAAVYLIGGKGANVKAVLRAHREFRTMGKECSKKKLKSYLKEVLAGDRGDIARVLLYADEAPANKGGKHFKLRGMWAKWTVLQRILKKESIFAEIKDII